MRRHGLWACWALAAVLAGCQNHAAPDTTSGRAGPVPELVAMNRPPMADLPVPIGFDLKEGKSRNFAAAGARYVDHVYTGSADKFAVGRFYKRQMPINRWALVTDMFVQGDILLDFEKDDERCRVVITEAAFGSTEVKIAVWTSGRLPNPPVGRTRSSSTRR